MFPHCLTRHRPLFLGCILTLALPAGVDALCPCWTTEDLRSAVAALPAEPNADPGVGACEVSVSPLGSPSRLSTRLVFQNLKGDRFEGAIAEFNLALAEQRCVVFDDGLGHALVPIEVVGLSEEEAAACVLSVGEVCQELLFLLPEPRSSLLQGTGVCMLGLLAQARRKARASDPRHRVPGSYSRPVGDKRSLGDGLRY